MKDARFAGCETNQIARFRLESNQLKNAAALTGMLSLDDLDLGIARECDVWEGFAGAPRSHLAARERSGRPVQVRTCVAPEARRDEQVPPILRGDFQCVTQAIDRPATNAEGRESQAIQRFRSRALALTVQCGQPTARPPQRVHGGTDLRHMPAGGR